MTDITQAIKRSLRSEGVPFTENEPMSRHTTFKTGGNADIYITPGGVDVLSRALRVCAAYDAHPLITGNGSNLLIPDAGLRRPVIHMAEGFDRLELDGCVIHCMAGTSLKRLCLFAYENALTGLEFAYGIPGSAGGAVYMNAGAYGGEMKDVLLSCTHLNEKGEGGSRSLGELSLSYRRSAYTDSHCVITDIYIGLHNGSKAEIKHRSEELMQRRRDKQPLEYPSAGSVFKRPEGHFAGALIEQCGLKGKTIGGAQVSTKHAGFIVNIGNATTKDVTDLIACCRETVYEKTGVLLEAEIKTAEDLWNLSS